jgi:hypothetical protein
MANIGTEQLEVRQARTACQNLNWEQQGKKVALIASYSIYTIQYQPL